ncbi:MAG: hypothetical protein JRC67_05895 [Deltaproteobacteria bacterium]|nr:hypothetical protein [Deltaproteobacteria bacterium]
MINRSRGHKEIAPPARKTCKALGYHLMEPGGEQKTLPASHPATSKYCTIMPPLAGQAWIIHELLSRDHKDGRATGQPQGVGSEAYLNGTSQGPTPEDARKDAHIRGRSKLFMNYPG